MQETRRIIVGVEDTPESHAALHWSAAEAWARGAELWLVHAYTPPAVPGWHTIPPARPSTADADAADRMLAELEAEAVRDEFTVRTRRVPAEGLAADVLVRLSEGAELLVVGGKRRLGMREAMMGSVARAVVRRAHCPVTVVHAGDIDDRAPRADSGRIRA